MQRGLSSIIVVLAILIASATVVGGSLYVGRIYSSIPHEALMSTATGNRSNNVQASAAPISSLSPQPQPQTSTLTDQGTSETLYVEVEKERLDNTNLASEVSTQYAIQPEKGRIRIHPHLILVYGGSELRVDVYREGDVIRVVEQEVLGLTLSSRAQRLKIAETIDTSTLPGGNYTLVVEHRLWNGSSNGWVTETVLQQPVTIEPL